MNTIWCRDLAPGANRKWQPVGTWVPDCFTDPCQAMMYSPTDESLLAAGYVRMALLQKRTLGLRNVGAFSKIDAPLMPSNDIQSSGTTEDSLVIIVRSILAPTSLHLWIRQCRESCLKIYLFLWLWERAGIYKYPAARWSHEQRYGLSPLSPLFCSILTQNLQ